MDATGTLAAVRDGLTVMYERYAQLVGSVADTSVAVPGLDWTIRDVAVHTAGGPGRYAALATGTVDLSAVVADKEMLDARMRSLIADNPETDPKRLADQIREGLTRFMRATATVPADQPIAYYAGLRPTFTTIAAVLLGEPILHGYDIATAVGAPWPIDRKYASLAAGGYLRTIYSAAAFQPSAAEGFEASYRLEIGDCEPLVVRIGDGRYEELPVGSTAECVISADPVTALLVSSRRLSLWQAIALGALRFSGDRPDVGARFAELFMYP
jgi:uncharacterized protein (TIGR03083 family)